MACILDKFQQKCFIFLFIGQVSMFKRLFSSPHNEIDKVYQQCKIDRTHEMPHTKAVADLAARHFLDSHDRQNIHININIQNTNSNSINININNPKHKNKMTKKEEFISHYFKKLKHENIIQRIKTLIAGHAILKKTMDTDFADCFATEIEKFIVPEMNVQPPPKKNNTENSIEIKVESSKEDYLQTNIISIYCFYLKKMIINFETYQFARKYPALSSEEQKKINIIDIINHGFIVLNLVNYILRSQYTFNKMGRYYLEHKELLGVFIKYLQDLLVFNTFIKSVTTLSLKNIRDAGSEQTKHYFLFVTEAQKSSDRLYEFFYNRYYYNQVKTLILMPTFLNIHNEEYKELVNHVKKRDKELVLLVKKSKYEQPRSQSCNLRSLTQATESESLNTSNLSMRTQEKDLGKTQLSFVEFENKEERREKRAMSEYKRKK